MQYEIHTRLHTLKTIILVSAPPRPELQTWLQRHAFVAFRARVQLSFSEDIFGLRSFGRDLIARLPTQPKKPPRCHVWQINWRSLFWLSHIPNAAGHRPSSYTYLAEYAHTAMLKCYNVC